MNSSRITKTLDGDRGGPRELVADAPLPPGTRVGEYELGDKIGEGGTAVVYAARHPLIGKQAAVKVLRVAAERDGVGVARFLQEARAANQIRHPNIIDVFAFGELPDGRSYMVMEWLAGETLDARLERGPIPIGEGLAILDQLADALQAAHAQQVIHRDLKPANIYLLPEPNPGDGPRVKLLDFGLAKPTEPVPGRRLTGDGVIVGTPLYLSPEQARGRAIDPRTDIYSLGVVAFEVFVGCYLFTGDNALAIITKHTTSEPPPLRRVWPQAPPRLEALLMRMLAKEPDKRPTLAEVRSELALTGERTAPELVAPLGLNTEDLDDLEGELTRPDLGKLTAQARALAKRPARQRRRRTLLVWLGLLAVATAIGSAAGAFLLLRFFR